MKKVAPLRRSSRCSCHCFGLWAGSIGAIIVLASSIVIGFLMLPTEQSLCYMGEPATFDDEIERELHIKPSRALPIGLGIFGKYHMKFPHEDIEKDVKMLESEYPRSIVPPVLNAYALLHQGNLSKGYEALNEAREKASLYPDDNPSILTDYILPPSTFDDQLEEDKLWIDWPQEIQELHPGKLWVVVASFRARPELAIPIPLNAIVFRLKDDSLIIINPGPFDEGTVAKINKLGTVKALVTTAIAHSECIEKMSAVWPEAALYGSDSNGKHGKPHLKWTGFITNESPNPFAGDLEHVQLDGHLFLENWFYDPQTKSMFGIVDTAVAAVVRDDGLDWGMHIYHFLFGSWRGSKTKPIGAQSYHHLFAVSRSKLKQSIEKALQWDIETILLGHGGIVSGPDTKSVLRDAYSWLLAPQPGETGVWGAIHNGFAWLRRLPVSSFIMQAFKLQKRDTQPTN